MVIKTFSITDKGKVRKVNQDCVYTSEKPVGSLPNLFIVADGMGGHKAGDYASKYTVETMIEEIMYSTGEDCSPSGLLDRAVQAANEHIRQKAEADENLAGMGTTVVAATCIKDCLEVANVGDSRLYLVNDTIRQITEDHSLVEEMIRMGGIGREEARNHPDKNIITRAVGAGEFVEADFFRITLKPGDLVLMCSDGLTNMLEDSTIKKILDDNTRLQDKAEELVRAANENGGKDNISVILMEPFAD